MSRNSIPPKFSSPEPRSSPALESRIARALAQAPAIAVPENFASVVTRRAFTQPLPQASFLSGWGPRLALASGALLTAAMFALAPHAAPSLSSVPFDAELVLLAELSTLLLFATRLQPRD